MRIGAQHLYDLGHRGTSPPPPNVDDAPWRWADASGEPLIINGLPAGPRKVLIHLLRGVTLMSADAPRLAAVTMGQRPHTNASTCSEPGEENTLMSTITTRDGAQETRPPLPPFIRETAIQKVRLAEDGWNSRDREKVALAYTVDSRWRNHSEFVNGRQEIIAFLHASGRRNWTIA